MCGDLISFTKWGQKNWLINGLLAFLLPLSFFTPHERSSDYYDCELRVYYFFLHADFYPPTRLIYGLIILLLFPSFTDEISKIAAATK